MAKIIPLNDEIKKEKIIEDELDKAVVKNIAKRDTNLFTYLLGLSFLVSFIVFIYKFGWTPETLFWPLSISLLMGVIWLISMNGARVLIFYVRKLHEFINDKF